MASIDYYEQLLGSNNLVDIMKKWKCTVVR